MSKKEERTTTVFTKDDFNKLIHHLQSQNNVRCLDVLRKHFYIKEEEGETFICINYFGNQLRDIVFSFLHASPSDEAGDVFEEWVAYYNNKPKGFYRKRVTQEPID